MEILHKIISSHQISSISEYFSLFEMIIENKVNKKFHPIMECFSEEVWKKIPGDCLYKKCGGNYRFSPGKMHKNFIKLYFFEMPLDYIILEVDDMEFGKLQANDFMKRFYEKNNQ